jgi:hypothetical protein
MVAMGQYLSMSNMHRVAALLPRETLFSNNE